MPEQGLLKLTNLDPVLGEESGIVPEIDATSNNVVCVV